VYIITFIYAIYTLRVDIVLCEPLANNNLYTFFYHNRITLVFKIFFIVIVYVYALNELKFSFATMLNEYKISILIPYYY